MTTDSESSSSRRRCRSLPPVSRLRAGAPSAHPGRSGSSGLWTNATLTVLQRPAELAGQNSLRREEAASSSRRASNRPMPTYLSPRGRCRRGNNVFFERGTSGGRLAHVARRRASRRADPSVHPGGAAEGRRATEGRDGAPGRRPREPMAHLNAASCSARRCPCCRSRTTTTTRSSRLPGYVTILVEMNHDARIIPLTAARTCRRSSSSGPATHAGAGKAIRWWSRRPTSSSTSRFMSDSKD